MAKKSWITDGAFREHERHCEQIAWDSDASKPGMPQCIPAGK